ncbi:hypothetical protein [Aphanothece sacrum]|uniref:RNA polymerase beta subunit n=1 Tax=Aphanothece sacrum FPU1 TaxID=1920663 RepID=A0A401IM21_APHSA|nr:hypothetical protein [Aphanothece sacrum]GBF82302.1 RNA polymerase beta subunit [Aphanothece sacrum FPU1]
MSQHTWAGLRVDYFFSTYNWSGIPQKLEPSAILEDPPSWLCFKLGDFIQQANWTGKPSFKPLEKSTQEVSGALVTLPVSTFLGGIVWGNNNKVGVVPKLSSPSPKPSITPPEFNVNNLSDLF